VSGLIAGNRKGSVFMMLRVSTLAARTPPVRLHNRSAAAAVEPLEPRALLSGTTSTGGPIVTPSHVVIVIEEDRYANAIGDTTNMPYVNQLASNGLVYSSSHGLNTTSQEGEMSYLGLFSGSTQGVTDNGYHGPFAGGNLSQSLNNKSGLSFASYAEAMPHAGDTTDNYAAEAGDPAYDDLYVRAYNPASQFTNLGSGKTNAQVNQTFATFPTTAAGYSSLPTVSFVIPDTLHDTHGSNDTNPYATDPGQYNYLRQTADAWLRQNLDGYLQWAKQNNSLLIVTGDEGDRAHNFAGGFATIINGASNLFAPGTDTKSVTPYNLLRTVEDMYGLTPLGNSASAGDYDTDAAGRLAPSAAVTRSATTTALSSSANPAAAGQSVTLTATVSSASGKPTGTVTFTDGSNTLGAAPLNGSGVATLTTSSLAPGSHSITAAYGGDANFTSSTSAPYSLTVHAPAPSLTAAPVVNGDNPNGLYNAAGQTTPGQQRSMVEDLVYTFSEPVTITNANEAFTLAVVGPAGGTLPTTLYAQAVTGSNGTQWAVSLTGQPIGTFGSIANGEYGITINPAYVFAAADGVTSMAPGTGRTDNFYRLYGDAFGTESVTNADYNLFKKSINTYNPEFDNFNSGTSSNADYNVFKKDLSISYDADGFVTTI
jgi:acid phosphatase